MCCITSPANHRQMKVFFSVDSCFMFDSEHRTPIPLSPLEMFICLHIRLAGTKENMRFVFVMFAAGRFEKCVHYDEHMGHTIWTVCCGWGFWLSAVWPFDCYSYPMVGHILGVDDGDTIFLRAIPAITIACLGFSCLRLSHSRIQYGAARLSSSLCKSHTVDRRRHAHDRHSFFCNC